MTTAAVKTASSLCVRWWGQRTGSPWRKLLLRPTFPSLPFRAVDDVVSLQRDGGILAMRCASLRFGVDDTEDDEPRARASTGYRVLGRLTERNPGLPVVYLQIGP
jgi:hypothetical protein